MIRRTNTASGAYLLRRAATLANAIRQKFGRRTEVHDGYLVEGRRSGERRYATVLEPPGSLVLVGPYDGMTLARVPAPLREFFSPKYPLRESSPSGDYSTFGDRTAFSGNAFVIGAPPSPAASTLAVGHAHVGAKAVYYPTAIYTGQLTAAGLSAAEVWLRVLVVGIGAHPQPDSFFVHQSVFQDAAPEYDLIPRNTAVATEWGSLPIATICELDGLITVAVQVARGRAGTVGAQKVTQGVVVLAIDPVARQVVWSAFQSAEAMPTGFVPQEYGAGPTSWAQSSFYHLTSARRPDGTLQVVGFYQVERTSITPSGEGITPVMAVADMTFSPSGATTQMVHADVRAPASAPIVAEFGGNPGYVLRPLLPHIVDNKVVVEAYRYKRAADWDWDPSGPDFDLEAPYSHVFYDGAMISTGELLGSMETKQPSVSTDIGTMLNPNQIADAAGPETMVYKGRELEGRGVGVTFAKPDAAKFEQLIAAWSGTVMGELLSVSCPQQELRDEAGVLVQPCTLVAMFTRGANDETIIGVRKGPIWPEDGALPGYMQYWRFYPIDTWAQLGAVYAGNPLVISTHGQMFAGGA